jgi:hypothetical protein
MRVKGKRVVAGDNARVREDTSLLERMIERLVTQRACLDRAADLVARLTGPVVELGLGKARTYDHLRRLLPHRQILVFDREIHAPKAYVPDRGDLYLGDFRDTLREAMERLHGKVVLLHADIGSTNRERDRQLVDDLMPLIDELMCDHGVVVTDREMRRPHWESVPLPSSAGDWTYYMYRVNKQNV